MYCVMTPNHRHYIRIHGFARRPFQFDLSIWRPCDCERRLFVICVSRSTLQTRTGSEILIEFFHRLTTIMAEGSISDLEKVKREIRSILTSCSGNSLSMRQLSNDYKSIIGRDIPFQSLGFATLTSFLNTLADTVYLDRNVFPRGATVRLVRSKESAHIQELVNDQRKNRKTSSNRSNDQSFQMRR